jgi:carboxypeptidase family protein
MTTGSVWYCVVASLLVTACAQRPATVGAEREAPARTVSPQTSRSSGVSDADSGVLVGRVTDSLGVAVPNAYVQLVPATADAAHALGVTDSQGTFSLRVPLGTYRGTVRRIGYEPFSWLQVIRTGGPDSVAVTLRTQPLLVGRLCTADYRHGIELEVRDSRTGAPAAEGAFAIARDGAYVDTLLVIGWGPGGQPLLLGGVHERPGVYDVSLRKSGYRDWMVNGIELTRDECHIITRHVQVRLDPVR